MNAFICEVCGQLLFFDNSTCLQCGSLLGFDPASLRLRALSPDGDVLRPVDRDTATYRYCGNRVAARCNWLVPAHDPSALCASCRLTTVRPNDTESEAMAAFADAESAKRRLIFQLLDLGLPIRGLDEDPVNGVAFELLSSRGHEVTTGHENGVITLDLSESDDAHREFVRQQLGEAYRTVLGHLRHEIGHYYWPVLVEGGGHIDRFRGLFGDERVSYQAELEGHYAGGPPSDWSSTHVSQYATVHPWEDWAETFAHYLHIRSGLQSADSFGLAVGDPSAAAGHKAGSDTSHLSIGPLIDRWLALTIGMNAMSRSIGQGDVYPFVLPPRVVEKLDFVHTLL
ncbi:MAG: putative zinc-binding peptidase [Acidimicrobiia bacterium]|nr:putative zinc-binding peptidase [Acidimicrobiia bacterium]